VNNLRKLDLNLLLTLDALLSEHNVTRTAQRLGFSQPAVSVHLGKLRRIFGDPLLLPGPRGMRPTARAEELREPLRQALDALERAVSPAKPFNPAEATQTWRIAASDYSESAIVQPVLAGLRAAAPRTRLAVFGAAPSLIAKQAEQGEIDLAFHTSEGSPSGLRRRVLFTERYVLVGRADHPRLRRRPTLAQFCALDHVIVSTEGGAFTGETDEALTKVGLARRVVLSVPHFLFSRSLLASTDLVAMLPERLVRGSGGLLKVTEPPIDVAGYEMAMLWHERSHRDPAHVWLREYIADTV
jgi:DNA-binding transcriptional LysR family regulator